MTLLFLPDIFVVLLTLTLVLILLDRTTGRLLSHLDTIRRLLHTGAIDALEIWRRSLQVPIDVQREQIETEAHADKRQLASEMARLELKAARARLTGGDDE